MVEFRRTTSPPSSSRLLGAIDYASNYLPSRLRSKPVRANRKQRHSYVAFYPSDWLSGTSHLPRVMRSAYFDLCCHMWEFAEPVSKLQASMILSDLPNAEEIVDQLIEVGKLDRDADGRLFNRKALDEGNKAMDLWLKKSSGGQTGAATRGLGRGSRKGRKTAKSQGVLVGVNQENVERRPKSPAKAGHSDAKASGGKPPLSEPGDSTNLPDPTDFPNKVDWLFHSSVIVFMCSGGAVEKNARAFIGKCRATLGEQLAVKRIREAFDEKVSDPIGWLTARFPKARNNVGVNRRTFDDVDYEESGYM